MGNDKEALKADKRAEQALLRRMESLASKIHAWNIAYYMENKSPVTDAEYDESYGELSDLERARPDLIDPTSPTQRVGGGLQEGFKTGKHVRPMLSIRTETNPKWSSFAAWKASLESKLKDKVDFVVEFKYDGLGLSLEYDRNFMVQALTRGDGTQGEDLTQNAMFVKGVPRYTNSTEFIDKMVVRGEVVMTHEAFKAANASKAAAGEMPFANTRNAASGSLRQFDPYTTKERSLTFIAYQIAYFEAGGFLSSTFDQDRQLEKLKGYGFILPEHDLKIEELLDEEGLTKKAVQLRKKLKFDIDGIVVKVRSGKQQELLGFSNREPNWAVAYKFPAEHATTRLNGIDIQVSRTGKLTPVARIEPVLVGGTVVSNVALHNRFDLRKRGVRVGDTVYVRRAGDVIPEIFGYDAEARVGYRPNFMMPKKCPACNSAVLRLKGEREYCCVNALACPAQIKESINHYVARTALDIDGLGTKLVEKLLNKGVITKIADIYGLGYASFIGVEGIGSKTVRNLLDSIEASKTTTFNKFIYGLGIRNVGENTSKTLAGLYKNPQALSEATVSELSNIKDIGPITAESIFAFFNNAANLQQANYIWGQLRITQAPVLDGSLDGKSFVVTGTFEGVSRQEIQDMIEKSGGVFQKKLSSTTNYLVTGTGGGGKRLEALKLGAKIITLGEFYEIINNDVN